MEALRICNSTDEQAQYGLLVNTAHRSAVETHLQIGIDGGAELVLDGRGFSLPGGKSGFVLGLSLLDHVAWGLKTYREEIFGPVLQVVRAEAFEEALEVVSQHKYCNGVAIFTLNGVAARQFADCDEVGMVRF